MGKKKNGKDRCKPAQQFNAVDGSAIRSLYELAIAMDLMSDDTFYHHVNEDNNDFSNWVRDVLNQEQLADSLQNTQNKDRQTIEIFKCVVKNN